MSSETFALSCYEILQNSYLTDFSTDWQTIWLIDYLMSSDKHNSINAKGMGLISSLFNVASSQDVPFRQPLQLQCSHHGSTKADLCSPLFFLHYRVGDDLQ